MKRTEDQDPLGGPRSWTGEEDPRPGPIRGPSLCLCEKHSFYFLFFALVL